MEVFTKGEITAYYAARLPTLRRTDAKEWRGPCPVHQGKDDNFAVEAATGRAFCFSGCSTGWDIIGLHQALSGQSFPVARAEVYSIVGRPVPTNGNPPANHLVDEYHYTDESGRCVFVIERRRRSDGKKDFKIRMPDGKQGWIWKKPPIAGELPYRLHRIINADTVYIPEGEQDVHTLESWGLPATTNAFGARRWKAGHAAYLKGKHVVVLPDNDADGRAHAEIVCRTLEGLAASIRVVALPDLPEKGDVTNWKEEGGTFERFRTIVEQTPPKQIQTARSEDARNFRVNDSGLYAEASKDDKVRFIRVGPRLDVIARTRNFEGDACGKQVQFRNWDGEVRTCIIPLASLVGDGKNALDRLLNLGYQPNRDRRSIEAVKDFIYQTNPDRFIRCVTRVGWHSDFFVLPDLTIGPNQSREEVLFQSEHAIDHKYQTKGTLESWKQNVSQRCVNNSRLAFALCVAFAPPLLDLLKVDGGGVHFRGLSSTGKTTALLLAGSVWGGSPQTGFVETWRATANGIEARAALHNHCLLCLDEIGEISEKEAGETVYALANGRGRNRMTRSITSRAGMNFRLLFLSTGERTLQDVMRAAGKQIKGGQEIRLLEIPSDAGMGMGIFESVGEFSSPAALAEELSRAAKNHYGEPIRPFLRHLIDEPGAAVAFVRKIRDEFQRRYLSPGVSGEVHRAASMFGLFVGAGELATSIGLTGWDRGEASKAVGACFRAWILNRGGTGARDVYHGIEAVRAFIQTHGASRFETIPSDHLVIRDRAGYKEKLGDDWRYYVFRETFKNVICHGYDHKAVARELIQRGHMEANEGRLTFKKRVPGGGLDSFFAVMPSLFEEDAEGSGGGNSGNVETEPE